MLEPGETRHISVNDIRDLQVPGALGQKMPKTVSSGQALISAPGPHDVLLAQSVVADPTQGVALTSSCTTCPPNAIYYTVSPSGTVDGLVGDDPTAVTPYCHLDDGTQYQVLNPFAIDWSPGNSSIASVTWNGSTAYLNFVGYGSTTVDSTAHDCVYQYNFETGQCDCTVTPLPVETPPQPRGRQVQWAVLIADVNSQHPICSANVVRNRDYQGFDDFGYISYTHPWQLNETVISNTCGGVGTGGSTNAVVFEDVITVGCNSSSCVFETNQTFSVADKTGQTLRQVPGKNCIAQSGLKMTDTECKQQQSFTGWHVRATGASVTVTNNQ